MAELDQITVATKRYIQDNPRLIDMVFQEGPVIAYAKQNARRNFDGGRLIQESFYYNGLIGGSYNKGKQFNITEKQIEQGLQFTMKFFEVNVTLSLEDVRVINKGPNAAFRLIDSRMQAAYMSIGSHMEIGMFLNGINANYTPNFNGLPEAINDNATASWDGNTYATYGTITRGGAVGTVLNSAPRNVNGTIEYNTLEETYGNATFGTIEPNLGVTTVLGKSFIKEKFQTQQRFQDTQDPAIGFNGLKFNSSTIIPSRYCPGSYLFGTAGGVAGTADPVATTYVTEMSNGALTAYPLGTGYTSGSWETLWWINARNPFFNLYISDDPLYGLGFTGWKFAQGNTVVAGQVLAGVCLTIAPRYHQQLYAITG